MELESTRRDNAVPVVRYATFMRRARAFLIDSAIIAGSIVPILIAADLVRDLPGTGRIAWVLVFAVLLLYEPLLVSRRGATIGHSVNKVIVISDRTGGRPSLARAFARYVVKLPLGLVSFVTMATTRRHKAVHDLLTGTTVQLAPTVPPDDLEYAAERPDEHRVLHPAWRRILVTGLYVVVVFFAFAAASVLALSPDCVEFERCTRGEDVLTQALGILWLASSLLVIVAGWRGFLFGARARHVQAAPLSPTIAGKLQR